MVEVTEQAKREGIASELADLLYRQEIIVRSNPQIANLFTGENFRKMEEIAGEDDKNLRMMETVLSHFGLRVKEKNYTKQFADLAEEFIQDDGALTLEKLGAYGLLKQNQLMCGNLVHESVQLSKNDVGEALALFGGIQFSMSRQMPEVMRLIEEKGVELIMGEKPATGMGGRIRDMAATAVGAVMSQVMKPIEEMNVIDVLKLDHRKASTLFEEIENQQDTNESLDLFQQLKLDLMSHIEAEEQTVYKHFQNFEDLQERLDDSWSEHEDMRAMIEAIQNLEIGERLQFRDRVRELGQLVQHHVDEEEDEIFPLFKEKADDEELMQLAGNFLQVKKAVQERLALQQESDEFFQTGDDELDSTRPRDSY